MPCQQRQREFPKLPPTMTKNKKNHLVKYNIEYIFIYLVWSVYPTQDMDMGQTILQRHFSGLSCGRHSGRLSHPHSRYYTIKNKVCFDRLGLLCHVVCLQRTQPPPPPPEECDTRFCILRRFEELLPLHLIRMNFTITMGRIQRVSIH